MHGRALQVYYVQVYKVGGRGHHILQYAGIFTWLYLVAYSRVSMWYTLIRAQHKG